MILASSLAPAASSLAPAAARHGPKSVTQPAGEYPLSRVAPGRSARSPHGRLPVRSKSIRNREVGRNDLQAA